MNDQDPSSSVWQVGIVAAPILVNSVLSVGLGLGLERCLAWAAVRTVVQLLVMGLVFEWVFVHTHWAVVLGIVAVMTLVAGHVIGSRGARSYTGLQLDGTLSVFGSTQLIGAIGLVAVLHVRPWYEP